MAVFFTADTHFNHDNVIQYSSRPFSSIEEMTERLIANWNDRVLPGDTVFHLGDFALSWGSKHNGVVSGILDRLNGQKWLIRGNHDRKDVEGCWQWVKVLDYHEIKLDRGGEHKQRIVLCHYAMRVWNQMHRGAWMLHGHSHGNLSDIGGKIMDVGVDCCGYRPVSADEVADFMNGREIVVMDHHAI